MSQSVAEYYFRCRIDGRAALPSTCSGFTVHKLVWITRLDGEYLLCAEPEFRGGVHPVEPWRDMSDMRMLVSRHQNYGPRRGRPRRNSFDRIRDFIAS